MPAKIKKTAVKETKTVKEKATSKSKASAPALIEKVSEDVLKKLRALKIETALQADIQWCLGSYRYDKNPSGLYEMAERALPVLENAASKNSKAVSAKLLGDLKKALTNR